MFILIVEPAPRLQSRQAPIIDPQAQLDVADIDRQIAWHKAQGRVDKTVSARDVVDRVSSSRDFSAATNLSCQPPHVLRR
jgi:hypothetical protein